MTTIWVTFRFVGWHYWPGAPTRHGYLGTPHRHEFHVRAERKVTHDDRDVEFCEFKEQMQDWAKQQFGGTASLYAKSTMSFSCEQMAKQLVDQFGLLSCSVSEDGENGASVYAE